MEQKKILTLADIAKTLDINTETARRWAVAGRIPAFRYNGKGRWRAFAEDIDKFLLSHKTVTATGQDAV